MKRPMVAGCKPTAKFLYGRRARLLAAGHPARPNGRSRKSLAGRRRQLRIAWRRQRLPTPSALGHPACAAPRPISRPSLFGLLIARYAAEDELSAAGDGSPRLASKEDIGSVILAARS